MTCLVPIGFLLAADRGSFRLFWNLFGTSNQLLAGLSLLAISIWLRRQGKRAWFALIPMALVMTVTVVSLLLQVRLLGRAAVGSAPWINGLVSLVLLGLASTMVVIAAKSMRGQATTTLPMASSSS